MNKARLAEAGLGSPPFYIFSSENICTKGRSGRRKVGNWVSLNI